MNMNNLSAFELELIASTLEPLTEEEVNDMYTDKEADISFEEWLELAIGYDLVEIDDKLYLMEQVIDLLDSEEYC